MGIFTLLAPQVAGLAAGAITAVTALAGGPGPSPAVPAAPAAAAAPAPQAKHVLAVSIDGLNPRAIRELGPDQLPTLHRLMRNGSFTLNARTEVEQTVTLPNHTGMMSSRRIEARKGGHGVTFNDDEARTTVHRAAGSYVASVFDVVHDRGRGTALYSSKSKFALFNRTWSFHGRADRVGRDNGRDKLDTFFAREQDEAAVAAAVRQDFADGPRAFTFWHIGAPDAAGHRHGWLSPGYMAAVKTADANLGRVLQAVDRSKTVVIVTADHGGHPGTDGHYDRKDPQAYRVPFIVWGHEVPRGKNLYRLNSGFSNPGSAQPAYGGAQPIRNGMVGNLAAKVLGLPAIPGSELNRGQGLRARAR